MIEMAVFFAGMFLLVMLLIVAFLIGVKMLAKGGKAAAAGVGDLASEVAHEAHQAVETVTGHVRKGLSHGQLLDKAEGLGNELVGGGYLTDAQWQPIIEAIATGLTKHKQAAAPAAEPEAAAT